MGRAGGAHLRLDSVIAFRPTLTPTLWVLLGAILRIARFPSAGAPSQFDEVSYLSNGLLLLEGYESDGGSLAQTELKITLEPGATVERIVLAQDDAEAVSVSQAEVTLAPTAVTLEVNQSQQFTATVQSSNAGVLWSINPQGGSKK